MTILGHKAIFLPLFMNFEFIFPFKIFFPCQFDMSSNSAALIFTGKNKIRWQINKNRFTFQPDGSRNWLHLNFNKMNYLFTLAQAHIEHFQLASFIFQRTDVFVLSMCRSCSCLFIFLIFFIASQNKTTHSPVFLVSTSKNETKKFTTFEFDSVRRSTNICKHITFGFAFPIRFGIAEFKAGKHVSKQKTRIYR